MAEEAPKAEAPKAEAPSSAGKDTSLAVLAHILGIVVGFIGPLIIYLVAKDKPYSYGQAKEALNFQITILIGYVIGWVTSFILIGVIIIPIVVIYGLVMAIIAAIAASKGEDYKYPFAIRIIK